MSASEKFFVISSLTGTDRDKILAQTKKLQPPVPTIGTPEYDTFVTNFCDSPANVMSTIAEFLRRRAEWSIDSDTNYQAYLNQFNGAPFIAGYYPLSGKTALSVHTVSDLLEEIYSEARIPTAKRSSLSHDFGLEDWFSGDFEDSPKTLQIIAQNLQSTDGELSLLASNRSITVSYFPPEKAGHLTRKKKELPTYRLVGDGPVVTLSIRPPSYFKENGKQYSGVGLTNVTDWEEKTSTPAE